MEKDICGIFVTEHDSKDRARAVVESMKNCPHLIMAGVTGERTSMVFIVPKSLRWWFGGPAENPEALSLVEQVEPLATLVNSMVLEELFFS